MSTLSYAPEPKLDDSLPQPHVALPARGLLWKMKRQNRGVIFPAVSRFTLLTPAQATAFKKRTHHPASLPSPISAVSRHRHYDVQRQQQQFSFSACVQQRKFREEHEVSQYPTSTARSAPRVRLLSLYLTSPASRLVM